MSLCGKHCEDINKCWDQFESIFSGTVVDNAPIKILSKKAKLWITKVIIIKLDVLICH